MVMWSSRPEISGHMFKLSIGGSLALAAFLSVGSTPVSAQNVTYQSANYRLSQRSHFLSASTMSPTASSMNFFMAYSSTADWCR